MLGGAAILMIGSVVLGIGAFVLSVFPSIGKWGAAILRGVESVIEIGFKVVLFGLFGIGGIVMAVEFLSEARRRFQWRNRYLWLRWVAKIVAVVAVYTVGIHLLWWVVHMLTPSGKRVWDWLEVEVPPILAAAPGWLRANESWFALALAVLLTIAVTINLAYTHAPRLRSTIAAVRTPRGLDEWKTTFRQGDAIRQVRLLQIGRDRLHPARELRIAEQLDLLIEVEDTGAKDPAAGVYWKLRQELEQSLRHELQQST